VSEPLTLGCAIYGASELAAAVGVSLTEADSLAEALQRCTEALVTCLGAAFARVWTLNHSEHAEVGIWDLDYATGVLRWSETIETHYGLQPGTFAGPSRRTLSAFIPTIARPCSARWGRP
jgi:hypothetical protein